MSRRLQFIIQACLRMQMFLHKIEYRRPLYTYVKYFQFSHLGLDSLCDFFSSSLQQLTLPSRT